MASANPLRFRHWTHSLCCGMGCRGLEGVPRAASMGLLLFGLPGIVLTTYGARLIAKAASVSGEGSDT